MTHADALRNLVLSIAQDAQRAVVRGNNALQFTDSAMAKQRATINDLEQARLQVLAEIELLHENVLPKMDALFGNTLNADITTAIEHFKAVKQLVEKYANNLALRLTDLDQTIALLIVWKEEELQASGREMLEAVRLLAEYNTHL